MTNTANWVRFFEETFLIANVSPEIILGMLFLILSGAKLDFLGWELRWRTYTTKKVFPTTRRIKLLDKEEFVAAALDLESEIFIIYVLSPSFIALPSSFPLDVYHFCKPQIAGRIVKEAPTKISAEYLDFTDVFSLDLASKFSKFTEINN